MAGPAVIARPAAVDRARPAAAGFGPPPRAGCDRVDERDLRRHVEAFDDRQRFGARRTFTGLRLEPGAVRT